MVYKESFKLESRHRAVSFHDITDTVKEICKKSGLKDGIVVVYSHHTTCSVITQECAFDMSMTGLETLQQDLVNAFEEWMPTCLSHRLNRYIRSICYITASCKYIALKLTYIIISL